MKKLIFITGILVLFLNTVYGQQQTINNGETGLVVRNKLNTMFGEIYDNLVNIQFSADGSTNWHETYNNASDSYFRISRDVGNTWSDAIPLDNGLDMQFSANDTTYSYTFTEGDDWVRFSTDDGITWSDGMLIAGNTITNTDEQTIDTFQLSGNNLQLSLENDGEAVQIVDLTPLADVDTIYTTPDYTFPIEYLKYTTNGYTIQVTDIPKPDGVQFPGYVTHQSGLTFAVSAAAYYINGELYISPSATLTLVAADATYDRIDLFVVDTLSQVSVITGTPSATPIQPQYDPTSQLPLIPMGVDANATTPTPPGGGSINSEIVYDENTEWTTSASGVTVDFNQTTTVHNGSIAAEGGTLSNGDYISFTSATAVGLHVYETFSFWLKLKEALWMKDDIIVQLYSSGNPIGQMVNIDYNYQTTDWQFISINVADFGTTALFNEIRITNDLFKATSPAGWFIDYVKLQGGIETPPTVVTGTDDQTASEVPVTVQNGIEQNNVQAELEAIREDMASGGDGWGTDTVAHDETLIGPGTVGDPLKVDTTLIETKAHAEANYLQAEVDGSVTNELQVLSISNDTIYLSDGGYVVLPASSGGIDTVSHTAALDGQGTTADPLDIADDAISYGKVAVNLTDTIVDNDLSWDFSGKPIIYSSVTGGGTIAISNAQVNKTICVVLTISSFTSVTVPAAIKTLAGSAAFADGTFYVYIHCIGTNLYTMSVTQEAS